MTQNGSAASPLNMIQDELSIRSLIDDWALYRDTGQWGRFSQIWHRRGRMSTTWFSGTAAEFIEASKRAHDNGLDVIHTMSGTSVRIVGRHAVAQTRMAITQRAALRDVEVDVTCHGRFFDFLAATDDFGTDVHRGWRLVRRQPIYDRDRMDSVIPGAELSFDPVVLSRFPSEYRYLAYLQTLHGHNVRSDMPVTRGAEVDQLYIQGDSWLAGATIEEII
ncbi:nuclear transport factor 2 family protein [Gordonia terrae]|uniref:nuclear transport factor 2 family protein n=1 Tax=Gordonia terrae TaxID=2055 RepID=UPI003F6AB19E